MNTEALRWHKLPEPASQRLQAPSKLQMALGARDHASMTEAISENLSPAAEEDFRMMSKWISEWKSGIMEAPGFVLPGFPSSWEDLRLRYAYALLCRAFGQLNDRYGWFFDVRDQGLDYRKEAIPVSKTRDSTGFHTDSTAAEYYPDLVGLLCLHPAEQGGDSLLVNAANLYEHLSEHQPEAVKLLSSPLLRDVITPGSEQNTEAILQNRVPVFDERNGKFLFRYMRFWTERAYEKTNQTPPTGLKEALDLTDAFFHEEANMLEFRMERGEVLLLNNTFICHNRTAFMDSAPGKPPRLLVRAWVNFR
jgi:hypothetical protein